MYVSAKTSRLTSGISLLASASTKTGGCDKQGRNALDGHSEHRPVACWKGIYLPLHQRQISQDREHLAIPRNAATLPA